MYNAQRLNSLPPDLLLFSHHCLSGWLNGLYSAVYPIMVCTHTHTISFTVTWISCLEEKWCDVVGKSKRWLQPGHSTSWKEKRGKEKFTQDLL